ncbi:redoxin domain-containing protein [Chitinophaga sp. SYP-B3965]|nr:redoxin domain-containing protein [Chitinophaga sp. SYP-B3965]
MLTLLLVTTACTLHAQDVNFTITGHLENVKASSVQVSYWSSKGYKTDVVDVTGNTYKLSIAASANVDVVLKAGNLNGMPDAKNMVPVFLGGTENFSITHKNTFSNATFTGSPENIEYHKLLAINTAYNAKINALKKKQQDLDMLGNGKTDPAIDEEIATLNKNWNDEVYGDYIRNNPSTKILAFAFNSYVQNMGQLVGAKLNPIIELLPDSFKVMPGVKDLQARIKNAETFETTVAIDKMAPDFTMKDPNDNSISLSSFRGKYVLIDFWASWCGPCRAENPTLVKAYEKYKGEKFEILGVSLDAEGAKEKWMKAIKDDGLTWPQISDLKYWKSEVVKLYGIQGIPLNFLIDPDGKIIGRSLRGAALEQKLGEIFPD